MTELEYDKAVCKDMDVNIFFPDINDRETVAQAKTLCKSCPIALQCFNYALENSINHGIFGGIGAKTRGEVKYKPIQLEKLRQKIINKEQ
jgi:WhiB family redox-sensing transcriptional regulator